MRASIYKSEISGQVSAPASKSYTIRGLMCAALASGESEIIHPLDSDDTEASLSVLAKIGVRVLQQADSWLVSGGNFHQADTDLFCNESAATQRFMTALCALVPGRSHLTSAPSLSRRPITPLLEALNQLGVDCRQDEEGTVVVTGGIRGGGVTEIPGNISSQFISALLLISPLADETIKIKLTTPLESQPFILMTLKCLEKFGIRVNHSPDLREFETSSQKYRPAKYTVEGDWSSASYLLALGAMSGEVEVANLNPLSLQGDKIILNFLEDMGAPVTIGNNSVTVKRAGLKAIKADLTDCIDLLPTVAVLAAVAEGVSEFTGVERARLKESNRVASVQEGLEKMGVKVVAERNKLSITGSTLKGSVIDSQGDHRIAMAFSLLGSVVGGTVIESAECVAKTYPAFWDILSSIGGEVKLDGQ